MLLDFKLFLRNLWRNKLYSAVTVFGFALALMFVILLTAYIRQELSVDQFHINKDRIFRCTNEKYAAFGSLIGEQLKNRFPEIDCYSRIFYFDGFVENFQREKIAFEALLVDSAFFRMFSFPFLAGQSSEVFSSKSNVVLSRQYALKLFGNLDVIGKEILINGRQKLLVTGIIEDFKADTHFDACDFFIRFDLLADLWGDPQVLTNNDNSSFNLFLMTIPGSNLTARIEEIIQDFKKDYWVYERGDYKEFQLEPLSEVYWSKRPGIGEHQNNKTFVLILTAIVIVLLVLALINYNNLSLARAGFRAKEAAIKKLVGVNNAVLFRQFMVESVLLCLLAFLIAVGGAFWVKPLFNQVLHSDIDIAGLFAAGNWVWMLLSIIALGMISGIAPAWLILRFNPVEVVKGGFRRKIKGIYGKILIGFQYLVAMVLLICTIIIVKQTNYLRNFDLGFDKENIIWLENRIGSDRKEALRSELMKIPEVKEVSFVCGNPIDGGNNMSFIYKDKPVSFQFFKVDTTFFSMMKLKVKSNGNSASSNGIYLNETAVKELGLSESDLQFDFGRTVLPILGIVKDFHFRALNEKIGLAAILPIGDDWPWSILVKIEGRNSGVAYKKTREIYGAFINHLPFDSGFMDESIQQWYEENERMALLIGYFSVVSVVLAMMGILAMATYFINQRVKEIGLRRVNGASVSEVLFLLLNSFMKWVVGAFLLTCPVSWWIMSRWIEEYPYRIDFSWWIFAVVGICVAFAALLMVGWQSIRVSISNPANLLKEE